MKRSTFLITFLLGISTIIFAQDPSAIADYESTTQGMLIPRMTQAQRNLIPSPATGLLVYQLNAEKGFWFYNGSLWVILNDNTVSASIADGDGDTKVQVEENPDEDRIRFDVRGFQAMLIDSNRRLGIGTNKPNERVDSRGNILIRNPAKNGALILSPSTGGYGVRPELVIQSSESGVGSNSPFHISRNALYRTSDDSYQYIDTTGKQATKMEFSLNGDLIFSMAPSGTGTIDFTENMRIGNATGHVGIATGIPLARLHIRGGGLLVDDTLGTTPVSGAGTRLMWIPEKAAFRAGMVDDSQWDADSIGLFSAVVGGRNGKATATHSFVGGGQFNNASGQFAFVGGGYNNTASRWAAFVGGGALNTAYGEHSFIGGGFFNKALGLVSFVGGGDQNRASGWSSCVVGGSSNMASGSRSFVGGGLGNNAKSYAETIFGTYNTNYTPNSTTSFDPDDRLFVIGNGKSYSERSNALTVLKSGLTGIGTDTPDELLETKGNILIRNPTQNGALIISPSDAGYSTDPELVIQSSEDNNGGSAQFHISYNAIFRTSDDTYQYIDDVGEVASKIDFLRTGDLVFNSAPVGTGAINFTENMRIQNATGNVGIGTEDPDARLHIHGGALLAEGTVGITPVSGAGRRLMWVPDKAAFRAGEVVNTHWDADSIGLYSSVVGGLSGKATATYSFVGGGALNSAYGASSFIGGGLNNSATGAGAFIGSGESNAASGAGAFIGGGQLNVASGSSSFVAGGYSNTTSNARSFVGGGQLNIASGSSSFVAGGYGNMASNARSFVGGGESNTASGPDAFVGGGMYNAALVDGSFIAGGDRDTAYGQYSFIGGGLQNRTSDHYSFIGGGQLNVTIGRSTFCGAGSGLLAESYAEAAFGTFNTDYTPNSLNTIDPSDRLFVIGNGTSVSSRSNAVTVLKNGKVGIGTDTPTEALEVYGHVFGTDLYTNTIDGVINAGGGIMNAYINIIADINPSPLIADGDEDLYIEDVLEMGIKGYQPGGGVWGNISDIRLKRDIRPYSDGLSELLQIRPVRYRYNDFCKIPEPEREFIGIIAQDMKEIAPYMVEERPLGQRKTEDELGNEIITDPGTPYLTFDGSALTYMLVNAVQEQQTIIQGQQTVLDQLRTANEEQLSAMELQNEELVALKSEMADIRKLLEK